MERIKKGEIGNKEEVIFTVPAAIYPLCSIYSGVRQSCHLFRAVIMWLSPVKFVRNGILFTLDD